MELRTACSPKDEKYYDTARLRSEFLIDDLFQPDRLTGIKLYVNKVFISDKVEGLMPGVHRMQYTYSTFSS